MMNIEKLIGIPFKNNGRDFDGCDCWGLVRLFYREVLGRELPEYIVDPRDDDRVTETMISELKTPKWEILEKPEPNCLALMKLNTKHISHCGIYLGNDRLLHCYTGCGSCIVRIKGTLWEKCINFYVKPAGAE